MAVWDAISADPKRTYLGAGTVYYNFGETNEEKFGVTKGGVSFTDGAEILELEGDGMGYATMGDKIINKIAPKLTFSAMSMGHEMFKKIYNGMVDFDVPTATHTQITRAICYHPPELNNIAFLTGGMTACTGAPDQYVAYVLFNPSVYAQIDVPAVTSREPILHNVEIVGQVDPDTFDSLDPTTYPYKIMFPTTPIVASTSEVA